MLLGGGVEAELALFVFCGILDGFGMSAGSSVRWLSERKGARYVVIRIKCTRAMFLVDAMLLDVASADRGVVGGACRLFPKLSGPCEWCGIFHETCGRFRFGGGHRLYSPGYSSWALALSCRRQRR